MMRGTGRGSWRGTKMRMRMRAERQLSRQLRMQPWPMAGLPGLGLASPWRIGSWIALNTSRRLRGGPFTTTRRRQNSPGLRVGGYINDTELSLEPMFTSFGLCPGCAPGGWFFPLLAQAFELADAAGKAAGSFEASKSKTKDARTMRSISKRRDCGVKRGTGTRDKGHSKSQPSKTLEVTI